MKRVFVLLCQKRNWFVLSTGLETFYKKDTETRKVLFSLLSYGNQKDEVLRFLDILFLIKKKSENSKLCFNIEVEKFHVSFVKCE